MTHTHPVQRTTDHDEIERWIEERQGTPAIVEHTWDGNTGVLQIAFGEPDPSLVEIPWNLFFQVFDESGLEFLREQHRPDGSMSRLYEFARQE